MASELDELIAMSDEDLDAEVRRLGGDPAQMIAETTRLVECLGKVRDAGVAAERERVRAVLASPELHMDIAGALREWASISTSEAVEMVTASVRARLGIDLRQPAGKGEG